MKKSKKQEIKQKSPSSMIKSPSKEKLSLIKRLKNWITSNIYNIYYIILLILLWGYIIMHWDLCITMQFFSHFDGNNILFIGTFIFLSKPHEYAMRIYDHFNLYGRIYGLYADSL